MSRNYELDSLKSREQSAFQQKQDAWQRYANARKRTNAAHDEMEDAWRERCSAREEMNREYEEMQGARDHYREVWDEYGRIRDENNSRIESLRYDADYEHQEMVNCFEQASNEYEYGDKSMAPVYSQEGREHKERRDELNAEISELCREIKEAKQNAEMQAPKTNSNAFRRAKEVFEQAKAHHESAQAEFKRLKNERDCLKAEFDSAQAEYKSLKEEFQRKLEEVKADRRDTERRMTDKVDMALAKTKPFYLGGIFGQDAKIVPRNDGSGKTDVYFAGMAAAGDGLGHGHAVIDEYGNVTYLRDAWSEHDDYLINDNPRKGEPTHK